MLPPLGDLRHAPVTLTIMAACVTLETALTTIGLLHGSETEHAARLSVYGDFRLGIWYEMWRGEVWRPFTTTLLHGNFLHMAFNVHCLWTLGPTLEHWMGSWRFAGLAVLLAYVSSLGEFVLWPYLGPWLMADPPGIQGLVGFSGVNYGLFGVCWIARRSYRDLEAVCPEEMVQWMLFWFVAMFGLTAMEWMPVANLAHATGLGLGVLIGYAMSERDARSIPWIVAATIVSLTFLVTMAYCPWHPLWRFR